MKDEEWLPWYMGGNGDFNDAWKNTPFTPINRPMYIFGLVLLGFPV